MILTSTATLSHDFNSDSSFVKSTLTRLVATYNNFVLVVMRNDYARC
jgi:hypothetical protein